MDGIERGIKTVLAYAADDAHGYELQCRDYDFGTDCAGLARLYAATVEGVGVASYPDFHTWDELATLTARGWTAIKFDTSRMRRGDLLLRALGDSTGHTVVYLGDGFIVGAEGNWDGRAGDSSGSEVCRRTYYPYNYNWIVRPPEVRKVAIDVTENGIYRLYSKQGGQHLLTSSHSEAEALIAAGWDFEGVPFKCDPRGTQKLYRMYNPYNGDHVYTRDTYEGMELAVAGWTCEGVAWMAPVNGVAVYRLYDKNSGLHHYALADEAAALSKQGWTNEGLMFCGIAV